MWQKPLLWIAGTICVVIGAVFAPSQIEMFFKAVPQPHPVEIHDEPHGDPLRDISEAPVRP